MRDHIYVIGGAGANVVVSAGRDGFFLVDSGLESNSDRVIASVHELQRWIDLKTAPVERFGAEGNASTVLEPYYRSAPPKPIRYIANTTIALDHIGGNAKVAAAGKTFTGGNVTGQIGGIDEGAAILAHENLLNRMGQLKLPSKALPTDTYFGNQMKLSHFFNGEGIVLFHAPAATTDGDSVVHFRYSDIIATGDIFRMSAYPAIDIEKGGSIQGVLDALNRIVDMSVAEFRTEGGTMFIGGHGRIGDLADLTYYRDMVHHHSRSRPGHDQEGNDARADQSGQTERGLGRSLRDRPDVDAGHVRRGDLQEPHEEGRVGSASVRK